MIREVDDKKSGGSGFDEENYMQPTASFKNGEIYF
jgi:hypothetical protein